MADGPGPEDNVIFKKGMRIVHLSYARISVEDPDKWLKQIDFFASLVEEMAKATDTKSVHCIQYTGKLKRNGVEYHFMKCNKLQSLIPLDLHRYIFKLEPDVIIVHGIHFPLQVLLLRRAVKSAKIILQHHSEEPLRHIKGFLQRLVDRFTSAYFFPSLEQAVPWVKEKQIGSLSKVYEVTEVPSVFYRVDQQKAKDVTKAAGSKIYLWVGRFDANKDPLTLIKGFIEFARTVAGANLYVIYQSSELIEEVKSILDSAIDVSGRIILVGKVQHDDLLYWFNSADFIISTSHYEGMGVAVCEGMSCGCIPILTDIPSFRAMTGNGRYGALFGPGEADDLKNKLIYSDTLNISVERQKVLQRYDESMSAKAISVKMISVCQEVLKQQ
jgi:glycosyltransferase involved in cell wall biosynthesis